MTKLLILIGVTVGGGLGWWAGAQVGLWTAFVLSTMASGVGLYVARRISNEYL